MSADRVAYLDSSAIVKLVVQERESNAVGEFLSARPRRASSALAQVEVVRAVRHVGSAAIVLAQRVLSTLTLIALDDSLLEAAARLMPDDLRSLDAIHLATALSLGSDLSELVTYDRRLAAAASAASLRVVAPS